MGWQDAPKVEGWQAAPMAGPKPKSFWQGVKEGVSVPAFNAARLAETAFQGSPVESLGNAISSGLNATVGRALDFVGVPKAQAAPNVNAAQAAFKQRQANAPTRGSTAGKFVGEVAGTLPTMLLPGGPIAQGAYAGGLMTNERTPGGIARDMALGGIAGKVGDVATRAVGRAVAPKVSQALRTMAQNKVRVTPGQAARVSDSGAARFLTGFEDRATSLPGPTGTMVRRGRERASQDFVKGAVNQSLGELGQALPSGINAGHEAVAHAQRVVSDAYDNALSGLDLVPDKQFADEVGSVIQSAQGGAISKPFVRRFQDLVQNSVIRRAEANNGRLSGDAFKTTISDLRKTGSRFSGSNSASEQEYGALVNQLADTIEGAARRSSSPESVAALDAADRAYAKLVRVEGAAKNATGGVFTPGQLETAVRSGDSSVRKRAVAAGKGLMQDYAAAGRQVLPSAIGDSGTATREAMWSLTPWLADLAAYYPYKAAQAVTPLLAGREPSGLQQIIGQGLQRSAPVIGRAAPIGLMGLLGNNGQ